MRRLALFLGALLLLTVFWPQSAEARCWWNGYRWKCTHHRHHYYRSYYYPYYQPYYYSPYYYRPYVCTPWPICWG